MFQMNHGFHVTVILVEISAQLDLVTEGRLSKPRQNVSDNNKEILQNLFSVTLLQEQREYLLKVKI